MNLKNNNVQTENQEYIKRDYKEVYDSNANKDKKKFYQSLQQSEIKNSNHYNLSLHSFFNK